MPPAIAARALGLLLPEQREARMNLVQPPMTWLIEQARELDGRLLGALAPGRVFVRFDGIQVPAAASRELAVRVAANWPETAAAPAALQSALAEAWPSWSLAARPIWTGTGTELLAQALPAACAVVGLWWD